MKLPDGLTARQLNPRLGIPCGADEGQIVVAEDTTRKWSNSHILQHGATVSIFEPLAGGYSDRGHGLVQLRRLQLAIFR